MQKRSVVRRSNPHALEMLGQQIGVSKKKITDLTAEFRRTITALQRESNRKFSPAILDFMDRTYMRCGVEQGLSLIIQADRTSRALS